MAKLSRRRLIAAAAAAPLGGAAGAPARKIDPVLGKVRAWIAAKDAQDRLVRDWQDLERRLCDRIRPLSMTLTRACRSGLPEARAMRALMRRIKAADRKLDRDAAQIVLMRATTQAGALAKIEMGLRLQEPLDCDEYAWALIQAGFEQLRALALN
jgi:hypothetical protein